MRYITILTALGAAVLALAYFAPVVFGWAVATVFVFVWVAVAFARPDLNDYVG